MTPVPKSGKDPKLFDNYRGITVTSIIGKLFEELLLLRLLEDVNVNQSDCQFGFTKDLNPLMSLVICSEAIVEAKMSGKPLYLVTIDTQKEEHFRRMCENGPMEHSGSVVYRYDLQSKMAWWPQ